jgi:hypothetical protein
MTDPLPTPSETHRLLATTEADLFAALVPPDDRSELHSYEDTVARGRQLFRRAFLNTRDAVCPLYRAHAPNSDEADLVVLIAGSLVGQAALGGIPVVPLATLMVKIGLAKLCATEATDE